MQPDTVVLVLTTWPAAGDPAPLAHALVESGAAACVSLLPEVDSVYRWQGRVERERERQLLVKTTAGRVAAVREQIARLHPYEVPELLVVEVAGGGDAYLRWVRESTSDPL